MKSIARPVKVPKPKKVKPLTSPARETLLAGIVHRVIERLEVVEGAYDDLYNWATAQGYTKPHADHSKPTA